MQRLLLSECLAGAAGAVVTLIDLIHKITDLAPRQQQTMIMIDDPTLLLLLQTSFIIDQTTTTTTTSDCIALGSRSE